MGYFWSFSTKAGFFMEHRMPQVWALCGVKAMYRKGILMNQVFQGLAEYSPLWSPTWYGCPLWTVFSMLFPSLISMNKLAIPD